MPSEGSGPSSPLSLRRQLEIARFERAVEICEGLAEHRALLTTAELARINNVLTGRHGREGVGAGTEEPDPWRKQPVEITLPSGKTEMLHLIADPKLTSRDRLHRATEIAESGSPIEAGVDIYAGLVLAHAFEDANRRTAVLAAHYFFKRYGVPVSGLALHELGLGDLREEGQMDALLETVKQMARFGRNKKG